MTISYNQLGSTGRMGNQMFQYAALRGISANRGFDFLIPPENYRGKTRYCLFDSFKMCNVKESNKGFNPPEYGTIEVENFAFDENIFNTCPDNCNLEGFFQTEKYFINIEEEIREDYQFNDHIISSCKEVMDDIGDAIFLHVRRGDYTRVQSYHPVLNESYYRKALDKFDSRLSVVVVSDDFEWCKEQDIFKSDRFFISESTLKFETKVQMGDGAMENPLVPFYDLCLMTMCKGGIIANSSLSWWGAWLIPSKDKKIVSPHYEDWFGPMYNHYVMDDLIPKEWEMIK